MKWMIASDIHGSAIWCERMLDAWRNEGSPRLILLGDLLYHGPRNDLPDSYAPRQVSSMLNAIAPHLLCIRGNCEAEVDQMMLLFPVMADYCALMMDDHIAYATHGHRFSEDNPPPLLPGDILLCGHTHIPCLHRREHFTYINPGSISIPKENSPHSFILIEDGFATWKDLSTGNTFEHQALW